MCTIVTMEIPDVCTGPAKATYSMLLVNLLRAHTEMHKTPYDNFP